METTPSGTRDIDEQDSMLKSEFCNILSNLQLYKMNGGFFTYMIHSEVSDRNRSSYGIYSKPEILDVAMRLTAYAIIDLPSITMSYEEMERCSADVYFGTINKLLHNIRAQDIFNYVCFLLLFWAEDNKEYFTIGQGWLPPDTIMKKTGIINYDKRDYVPVISAIDAIKKTSFRVFWLNRGDTFERTHLNGMRKKQGVVLIEQRYRDNPIYVVSNSISILEKRCKDFHMKMHIFGRTNLVQRQQLNRRQNGQVLHLQYDPQINSLADFAALMFEGVDEQQYQYAIDRMQSITLRTKRTSTSSGNQRHFIDDDVDIDIDINMDAEGESTNIANIQVSSDVSEHTPNAKAYRSFLDEMDDSDI